MPKQCDAHNTSGKANAKLRQMSKDDKSDEVPRIVLADDAGAEVIDFLDSLNRHLTKDETSAVEREIEKILGSSTNLPALTGPSPVPEAEPKAPVQQDEVKPELSKEEIEAQKAKLLKEARATFTNTNLPRIEPAASTSYEKTSGFFIKNLPLLGALYVAVIVAAVSLDGVRAFAHDKTAAAQIYNENGQYQEALKEASGKPLEFSFGRSFSRKRQSSQSSLAPERS